MNSSRLAPIPLDHVIAEVAAFPLASESALALGLTSLDPGFSSATGAGQASQHLWRHAERHLLGGFPAFSVDEVVAIRDKLWFADGTTGTVPLHTYLRRLARGVLESRGATAVPRLMPDGHPAEVTNHAYIAQARQHWRWLSLALPPDLLLSALRGPQNGPERIELLSPSLARHLHDHGYAEPHLHLGAALDFPHLWVAVLYVLASRSLDQAAFISPGAGLEEGRLLGPWLVHAALARYLLAAYLAWGSTRQNFTAFLYTDLRQRLIPSIGAESFALLLHALAELHGGTFSSPEAPFAAWQDLYAHITGVTRTPFPRRLAHLMTADPIAGLMPPRGLVSPEMRFVTLALAHLERAAMPAEQPTDPLFTTLFWQIVRVRSLFYRHVVQRPMTPGLQWFVRFYGRLRPARMPFLTETLFESAASLDGARHGLRALEIRTSPSANISELLEFVRDVEQAASWYDSAAERVRNPAQASTSSSEIDITEAYVARQQQHQARGSSLEVGIVFHFTKDRGGGALQGNPKAHWHGSHADPVVLPHVHSPSGQNPSGYRYARYYAMKRNEALALAWLLRHYPLALELVRGLDVCTDELGVPTWVLVPLLTHVHQASEAAAGAVQRQRGLSLSPLRTTVHAGEDFVHLLTGLRHVDEAIDYLQLREGDRIGHGLALGVDPQDWARRVGRIPMRREERLFDLVWAWSWYAREGSAASPGEHLRLEHEIARLSEPIFGQPITPYMLALLVQDLHTPNRLRDAGFPQGPPPRAASSDSRLGHLVLYLTDPMAFERSHENIWVEPYTEGATLTYLQAALRRKVGTRGITVEVNPTSNMLIGDLGDLTTHPLWRLHPPRQGGDVPPVSLCIGSDDPVIFGSDLRQEYQLLSDAMTLAGLSDEEARQWLDRTRASGLESRFTLPTRVGRLSDLYNLDEATGPSLL